MTNVRLHSQATLVAMGSFLLGACASHRSSALVQERFPQDPPGFGSRRRAGEGTWGERVVVEGSYVPAMWLYFDDDGAASGASEAREGSGVGARAAVGNRDQSIGVLWQGVDFDDEPDAMRTDAGYVDFDVRVPLQDGGGAFSLRVAAGFGAVRIDRGIASEDPEVEGAAQLRAVLGWNPVSSTSIDLGIGGMAYGHPGDTAAYGSFALLSVTFVF